MTCSSALSRTCSGIFLHCTRENPKAYLRSLIELVGYECVFLLANPLGPTNESSTERHQKINIRAHTPNFAAYTITRQTTACFHVSANAHCDPTTTQTAPTRASPQSSYWLQNSHSATLVNHLNHGSARTFIPNVERKRLVRP